MGAVRVPATCRLVAVGGHWTPFELLLDHPLAGEETAAAYLDFLDTLEAYGLFGDLVRRALARWPLYVRPPAGTLQVTDPIVALAGGEPFHFLCRRAHGRRCHDHRRLDAGGRPRQDQWRHMAQIQPAHDFTFTDLPQVHAARRREILRRHPEIRALAGPHWSTPVVILPIVAVHLTLAWLLREVSIGWAILLAYAPGAFVSHALYVLIHECAHNLAARRQWVNKVLGIVCDLPLAVPSAMVFRTYHMLHHRHLGELAMDPDIVTRREARLVGSSTWRKALWLALFSISQAMRPLKTPGARLPKRWVAANLLAVLAVDVAVAVLWGLPAFLYLLFSTLFALGLHPLGGRWLQEHYVTHPGQETYSYYGPLNRLSFDIGYHNEHHDFMNVPWPRLRRLHRIAAPFYDRLASYRSWTGLVLRFVLDRRHSPYSRIVHPNTRRAPADTTPAAS